MATSVMTMRLAGEPLGYQQHPQLERHNALRRTKDTDRNQKLPRINKKDEAWIHKLVRPPSLESLKPQLKSQEWKVPDLAQHLTSISCHQSLPLIAVGSGGREKNLLIYEKSTTYGSSSLHHRQTVSLPYIHSLAWAPLGRYNSNTVIATGHRNGLIHIVKLPDASNPSPARIVKKFTLTHPRRSLAPISRISRLEFSSPVWTCVPDSSLISLYGESVYMWDLSRNDRPLMSQRVGSMNGFHASPFRDGILSLSGAFGIALLDVRSKNRGLLRPNIANHSESTVVKWSPYNSNWIASAHEDNKIRIWDIRAAQPFAELYGHSDIINTLDWSVTNPNELISGSSDKNINIWDVTSPCFGYDSNKSKEKLLSRFDSLDNSTIVAPDCMDSARRRRALFTILEDPQDSKVEPEAEGMKSYQQSAPVVSVVSLDVAGDGAEFCSISTDGMIALHQMKQTLTLGSDILVPRPTRRENLTSRR